MRNAGEKGRIDKRRALEETLSAEHELLKICNQANTVKELSGALTGFMKRISQCEAVGIRLKRGEDYPYYETRGFEGTFVESESSLCAVDREGRLLRDGNGNPILECMCGNIIAGRFNPAFPFFTAHGSFWSGNTTALLANTTESDRQARTRNRCNGEGYESVALVPLRIGKQTFGLFQFNDRSIGKFDAEKMALFEHLADYVSIALSKLLANEALHESEARFQAVFEQSNDGITVADLEGRYVMVNPVFCRMVGYSREELLAMRIQDLLPEQTKSQLFEQVSIQKMAARRDGELQRKDGTRFFVSVSGAILQIGERQFVQGIVQDITETRRLTNELNNREEHYRLLYEGVTDAIMVHALLADDPRGRFIEVNDVACKRLGYTRAELLEMSPSDIDEPNSAVNLHAAKDTISTGQSIIIERVHVARDGRRIPVEIHSRMFMIQGQQAVISLVRDITDRKRAEEATQRSEKDLKKAQAVSHTGSWRWDMANNTLSWSDEMYRIFGIRKESFTGVLPDVIAQAIHPDDRQKVDQSNLSVIQEKKPVPLEYRIVWPDGSIRTVWAEAGELTLDEAGAPAALTGIVQDITARKKAEEQIRQSLREKETLLRDIHHRVKNNLQVISSLLSLQARQVKDADLRQMLEESRQRVKSMALIHEKLYQTKDLTGINVREYITNLGHELLSAYHASGRTIELKVLAGDILLDIDTAVPCSLILNELITNSIKYAFPKKRNGTIAISFVQTDGSYALTVRDNGVGLPPGFELGKTTSLGLRLVEVLTRQLRGTLRFASEGGTEVVVTFAKNTK